MEYMIPIVSGSVIGVERGRSPRTLYDVNMILVNKDPQTQKPHTWYVGLSYGPYDSYCFRVQSLDSTEAKV